MKKLLKGLALSAITLSLLTACQSQSNQSDAKKNGLNVVTTFYPIYDFTKEIVGEEGEVSLMIPAGSEPHDYEPSVKDMAKLNDADAFVYHNENMETWVHKALKNVKEDDVAIVKGTENMVLMAGEGHDHDHGDSHEEHEEHDHEHDEDNNHDEHEHGEHDEHSHELDPHTWVSPRLAMEEVESITAQLKEAFPKKAETFEKNAQNYLNELKQLEEEYQTSLSQAKNKTFVTQHAAFGYLALDYGLKQVAIAGMIPEQEAGPARLAELKEFVQENDIQYIYFEENMNDKYARTLAEEAKVKLEVLNPLESLSNEDIKSGKDYISVMRENLKALEKTTKQAGKEMTEHDDVEKTVAAGYFEDHQVKDRDLSDYEGDWQSVYPLLKAGQLDAVFDYKAKQKQDKTAEEYRDYYEKGYQTDVDRITIKNNRVTYEKNGEKMTYPYTYKGYEILTYEKGNRGVRYLFEATEPAGEFQYIQFSDHQIAPHKAEHYHLYMGGDSQEKLFSELSNWPTYYPTSLSAHEVAQEMVAH